MPSPSRNPMQNVPLPISETSAESPVSVLGSEPAAFDAALVARGWPKFRGKQIRQWVFERLVSDPDGMSDLSKADRQRVGSEVQLPTASIIRRQDSTDGTRKL